MTPQTPGLRWQLWSTIGLCILAFGLRIIFLGQESLWIDEAFSWRFANKPVGEIWGTLWRSERHPPLYYLLLHFTMFLGQSEFILRLPSVIFGVLSAPLLLKLGQKLCSLPVAWQAALLMALSPFTLWYSQEARMYALAGICSLGAVYCLVGIIQHSSYANWLGYICLMTLSLYSLYTTLLLLIFVNLFVCSRWLVQISRLPRIPVFPWLAAQLAIFLLYLPWIPTLSHHWHLAQRQTTYPLWILTNPTLLVTVTLLGLATFAGSIWWLRHTKSNPFTHPFLQSSLLITLLIIYGGITGAIVIHRGLTLMRQFYIFVPFLYLALGVLWERDPNWRRLGISLLVVSTGLSLFLTFSLQKPVWREAVKLVLAESSSTDAIILMPPWQRFIFQYYAGDQRPTVSLAATFNSQQATDLAETYHRAWLMLDHKEERLADPQQRVRAWFYEHYSPVRVQSLHLIDVSLFTFQD